MRYKIYRDSASNHCCFKASVIDTKLYEDVLGHPTTFGYFEVVCECFDEEQAKSIVMALNDSTKIEYAEELSESPHDPNKPIKET